MIEARDLTRSYGSFLALKGITLHAHRGEVLGFLGPNGAGKSTAMKLMTGMLVPDAGQVTLDGLDLHNQETALQARAQIGWMPERVPLYDDMECAEYLAFVAGARGLRGRDARIAIDSAIDAVELAPMRYRPLGQLSRGYRQRAGLAQALLHSPKVLILDEPTSGLDPTQIEGFHALLRKLANADQCAIIFSTHILTEAEAIADRLSLIHHGRIVMEGTCNDLRSRGGQTITLRVRDALPEAVLQQARQAFPALTAEDRALRIALTAEQDGERAAATLSDVASQNQLALLELRLDRASMADAFRSVLKEGAAPQPARSEA